MAELVPAFLSSLKLTLYEMDISPKADLDGTIFAEDYRARLAWVMTDTQDIRTTHCGCCKRKLHMCGWFKVLTHASHARKS